jgi:AcrR family transcriptional regulator
MSNAASARTLRNHVASLETMTRFVLATLALASGVYTYLGVRSLLDGSATMVFFAAIIYSVSVSVGMYGFWTYMIRFLPELREGVSRLWMLVMMAIGCAMIIAMSSWLNAAALAGSAAVEQHLAVTLQGYTEDLDQANSNAIGALSLLPDIQRAAERFGRLAEDERTSGALTGTTGSGSVVQLLSQMSAQMRELETTIVASRQTVQTLFEEGQGHLATMRGLVSAPGAIAERSDAFAKEAVALAGVIASLERTSIAPSVSRAAADLSAGFIAPVADGRSADLAGRQDAVMATVRESVAQQSRALSDAAAEIIAQPKVAERRYVPLTSAEAVIRYWDQFIPSWAGAISIDLLPAALVGIMAVVFGAIRRGEETMTDVDRMSAGDVLRALEIQDSLLRKTRPPMPAETAAEAAEAADTRQQTPPVPEARPAPPENVTPLTLADRKRSET